MAAYQKFNQTNEDKWNAVHDLSAHQLVVALTNVAPVAANSVLADLTQISYTNLSSRNITTSSEGQTAGVYRPILADLTLTASGGAVATFRYVVIYNDTPTSPADPLIGFVDQGSGITLADGESVLIDFDGTLGLFSDT